MSKKVSDILPKTEILAQLAEEASELAQAALKLRRALDGTNPTPKNVEEWGWIVVRGYDSKEEAEAGHDMWVKSAKAGFQKRYDVFEEKIFPKEKQEEKPVYFILKYACDRCMTSVNHEAYMKKKEFQEKRFCPFCGGELHMREFQIM